MTPLIVILAPLFLGTPDPELYRLAVLRAPSGETGIGFGADLALDGDWLAVGAPGSELAGPDWGAVFLFHRDAGGPGAWGPVQTLLPASAGFGGSVALRGGTLVLGAGGVSTSLVNDGVHLYTLDGSRFVLEEKLPDPFGSYATGYGKSVAVEGDVVAVSSGNYSCSTGTGVFGTVQVHERDAGGSGAWGLVASFTTRFPGSEYAHRIDLENGTLAINEPWIFFPCQGFLSPVYLRRRDAGGPSNWGHEADLLSPSAVSGLGFRLGLSGNLAVAQDFAGVAVFDRNAGGASAWGEVAFLEITHPVEKLAVEVQGRRLFVGVEDGTKSSPGEVRVYERHLGGENAFGLLTVLTPRQGEDDDRFGGVLSPSGDELAVGALGTETVHLFGPPATARGRASRRPR